MGGKEEEYCLGKLETMPDNENDSPFPEGSHIGSLRDFWRASSGISNQNDRLLQDTHEPGHGGHRFVRFSRLEENPRLESYIASTGELAGWVEKSASVEATRSSLQLSQSQAFFEQYSTQYPQSDISSSSQADISAHDYLNIFKGTHAQAKADMKPRITQFMIPVQNQLEAGSYLLPHMAHDDSNNFSTSSNIGRATQSLCTMHQDMETLRQVPKSNDLLIAITASAAAAVNQERGSGSETGQHDRDDDEKNKATDRGKLPENEEEQLLRDAIVDHPLYPELVVAHISIFKIGAPKGLLIKLDEMEKKFQRFQYGESSWNVLHVTKFGQDPSLDFFMRSYIDLLTKFREDLENPYNKFAQYKDKVTKDLEDLCGHYIETTPDEEDNFGSDIGTKDMSQDLNDLEILGEENLMYTADIDESIVIDPDAADEELKKMLRLKYGKHIAGLKAEFNRVRKKGKLPTNARQILKDWFSRHSYWPYPSEMEKAYLQRLCGLNLKQINNWFINERKRHWSCEGKCMYPNTKFYPRDGHVDPNNHGEGYLEQ